MKALRPTKFLLFLFIGIAMNSAAQEKEEGTNSFYLGFSPLDMLQGNLRIEPAFSHLNLRIAFPLNIYCLPEVSSRLSNPYSQAKNVGNSLSSNEKGDLMKGFGFNVRPVFLLKSKYGPIRETKYTFISFSLGYHWLSAESRGLGYTVHPTPDGKDFYDFGRNSGNSYKIRMIPIRFHVGKEIPVFKSLRLSYWVGFGFNLFQSDDLSIDDISKSGAITSIFYSRTPFPVFNLQLGKSFWK